MSDDRKDAEATEEITRIEGKPSQSTYEQLRNMNEYILNGVRFVKRSNRGSITIHSTGSQEGNQIQPFDSRIPDEEAQAIINKYMENLKADAKAPPAMSKDDKAYIKRRLEIMDAQDRTSMEEFLKAHPTLTPEEYMEMVVAHGF